MVRNSFILILILALISCNASILMTNGEISKPGTDITESGDSGNNKAVFSKKPATGINATKSYYEDHISVRWDSVEGADYYTLERSEQDAPLLPPDAIWNEITGTVTDNSYSDRHGLEVGKYYNYRVTAHTFEGESGEVSSSSVGTVLSSPSSLSASKGTNETSIIISWTQIPYVESYEVYKSTISSVQGSKSEYVETVNADDTSALRYYVYEIDPAKEKGIELYFAVVGLGPTGEKAQISFPRSGYTLVPGAPVKPEVIASKGSSSRSVEVRFRTSGNDSDYLYEIRKSYPGSAEQVVFTSEYDTLSEKDENGYYVFTDNSVSPNVEYRYSVTASNSIGISQAGIDRGYLLSAVRNLKLVPSSKPSHFGYDISFLMPVGADDEKRSEKYTYHVTKTLKNGTSVTYEYTEDQFASFDSFIPVSPKPDRESEMKEVKRVSVYVTNESGEKSSAAESNGIPMLPDPVSSISATRFAKPLSGDAANSSGVYPVHVTWTTESTRSLVLTRKDSDGKEEKFTVSGGSFDDVTTVPLVKYDYFIDTSDELGRTLGEIKHASDSYAAVTPEVYIGVFESAGLKPWERQTYVPEQHRSYWKKSKIATLVGYGNASDLGTQMKALDNAEDTDHCRGGKITYSAAMEGVGGQIYFTYASFGENPDYSITGNYEMHVNASGTGSTKSDTDGFNVEGMYPGRIVLDKMSVENKSFKGSYVFTVEYSDGSEEYEYEVSAK